MENPELGIVELNKSGAKSTVFHGISREKIMVVPAIIDVIQKGKIISKEENWKNRDYDTVIIAGKGKVKNKSSLVGVIVKTYPNTQSNNKFYLHEIIKIEVESDAAANKSLTYVNDSTSTYGDIVLQNNNIVNSNSMQNTENDTSTEADTAKDNSAESVSQSSETKTQTAEEKTKVTDETLSENNIAEDVEDKQATENNAAYEVENVKPGLIKDADAEVLTDDEANALDLFGKAVGVPIKIVPSLKNGQADGEYRKGVIYIAQDAENKLLVAFSHEVTHHFEKASPKAYAEYGSAVLRVLAADGHTSVAEMIEQKIKDYAEHGVKLTPYEAQTEIVADYTKKFINDPNSLIELLDKAENISEQGKMTILQRFIAAIKNIIAKFKGKKSIPSEITNIQKVYDSLVDVVREAKGNYADVKQRIQNNKEKYSLKKNVDNKADVPYNEGKLDSEQHGVMWTLQENTLSKQEVAQFYTKISETKSQRLKNYTLSNDGDIIYEIGDNKLVYTDGDYNSPFISKVIEFDLYDYSAIEYAKGEIIHDEQQGNEIENAIEIIKTVFGEGSVRTTAYESVEAVTGIDKGTQTNGRNRSESGGTDTNSGEDVRYRLKGVPNLTDYIEKYGTLPKGENPVRDVDVPQKISEKKYVSRFARTAMEAGVTPDESISEFEQLIMDGKVSYERIGDKDAEKYAKERDFDTTLGKQTYALKIGGKSYTIDWAVPTLFGQVARTIDKTQRTTYNDKNSQLPAVVNKVLQQTEKKIPFLSMRLQPKIDLWGREVTYSDSAAIRGVSNFLSPGYYKEENITEVDKKIMKLHEKTGNSDCIPSAAAKKITLSGKTINLTASEYTEFAKLKGRKCYESARDLMNGKTSLKMKDTDGHMRDKSWSNMTNAQKVNALKRVYEDASDEARDTIARKHYPKEYNAAKKKSK